MQVTSQYLSQCVGSYQQQLDWLEARLNDHQRDDVSAYVLNTLLARDQLALPLSSSLPHHGALQYIAALDKRLLGRAADIEKRVGSDTLQQWREARQPPSSAWWWSLDERAMPYLGFRILTAFLAVAILAVWINFALSVASPGFDLLSVLEVGMPLLIGTTFTRFGRNLVEQVVEQLLGWLPFFSHRSMPKYKFVVAGGVLGLSLWLCFLFIPQWATDYYHRKGIDALARNHAQAEQYFRRALSFDPDYAEAHYSLGTALEKLFRYEEAIDAYQRAIQIDEYFFAPYNNLARLYLLTEEDYTRALAILQREHQILPYPEDPNRNWVRYTFHKNRAWAYFGLGLLKSAEHDLNAALSFYNIGANAYCLRAQVYQRQGRPEEVIRNEWRQCIDNNRKSYDNQDSPPNNVVEDHWLGMAREQTEQTEQPE